LIIREIHKKGKFQDKKWKPTPNYAKIHFSVVYVERRKEEAVTEWNVQDVIG
jgi:hypothetical protein